MLRRRICALTTAALLASALGVAGTAAAEPADPPPATAADPAAALASPVVATVDRTELPGWLRLRVQAPTGSEVVVREQLASGTGVDLARLTLDGPSSGRAHLAPWLCDRRDRRFTITVTPPGEAPQTIPARVITPSCRDRLVVAVTPRRPVAGRPLQVTVRDRWHSAPLTLRLCVREPLDTADRCRREQTGPTAPVRTIPLAAPLSGRYRVVLQGPGGVVLRRALAVGPRPGALRLLATGDSEIQILDTQLAERLRSRNVRVTSDAHVGSGIAKLFQLDWMAHAQRSALDVRPDVTVVFLGANDGYGIGAEPCCGPAWSDAYALRAARMMRSYTRRGAGRVFWVLLPAPREAGFRTIFDGVNRALRIAAARVPGVRLVDLDPAVAPGHRFRQTVVRGGRTVNVRQPDGVHLSVAGSAIAADVIVAAMRAEGAL